VVLALFLQGNDFTLQEKKADFDYYDPLTTGDSTLSAVVQAIVAAEIGYRDLALEYFAHAAYVDLDNKHGNTADGVHVASVGGVWMTLVNGFAGMRDYDGLLSFDPRLPDQWPSLAFRLSWHGSRLRVRVTHEHIAFELASGQDVHLSVRGAAVTVSHGEPIQVALSDQGPHLTGRPTLRQVTRQYREDGTPLTAGVPTVGDDQSDPWGI
jgi:alpha,alpha-trehalose phosphorylase